MLIQLKTVGRPPGATVCATRATAERQHDVVAWLHFGYGFPDPLHNPGTFVPKHTRQRHGEVLVPAHEIGMTQACSSNPDQDLVVAGIFDGQRLDSERPTLLAYDRTFDLHD